MSRPGITRTEIVLLVLLFGAVLAVLVPYVYRQRLAQRRQFCEKRQLDTAKAILAYEDENRHFPGYCNLKSSDDDVRQASGWVGPILPQLGANPERRVLELICPDNKPPDPKTDPKWLSWVVNSGLPDQRNDSGLPPDWPANGVFLDQFSLPRHPKIETSLTYLDRHDGAAHTLLLSENLDAGRWTDFEEPKVTFVWTPGLVNGEPTPQGVLFRINRKRGQGDGTLSYARPSSHHRGGVNVVLCDTATRFLSENIDYLVFCRLMTPDDNNLKQAGSEEKLPAPYSAAGQ